ncbi:Glutamate receptor, metabotropic, partial [Daphnia magna]
MQNIENKCRSSIEFSPKKMMGHLFSFAHPSPFISESDENRLRNQNLNNFLYPSHFIFRDMHQTVCKGQRGLCKEMVPIDGSELLKYLRRVEF